MREASGRPAAARLERAARAAEAPLARLERAARAAGRPLARLDRATAALRPWTVLLPLVGVSWLVLVFVARAAVHTGPVYFNGGDGTWFYTTAWVLGHGQLPNTSIGYGYSMLLAPFARLAGPNIIAGIPYAIALNAILLCPVALLAIYGIAKLIAGRRAAYLVSLLWVLAPLLAIPYFSGGYHRRYVGETLPAVLGLTPLGDLPSMVLVLVAAYFCLRAIFAGRRIDAVTAGLAAGLAIAVKPANGAFVPALLVGLLAARRWRGAALAVAGLVPALVCLIAWKERGLGRSPLFAAGGQALAAGPAAPPAAAAPLGLSLNVNRYLHVDWHTLSENFGALHQFMWSAPLVEWTIVAGAVALARRTVAGALMAAVWLAAYLVLKGSSVATVDGGNFFRYLAPAFPAAFLLALSVPLLLPFAGRRLAAAGDLATWPVSERARRTVLGAGAFLGIAPLVPILALPRQSTPIATTIPLASLFVPSNQFPVQATVQGKTVRLSWPAQSPDGARVQYNVFRSSSNIISCLTPPGGSLLCNTEQNPVRELYGRTHWLDRPGRGRWIYRIVVSSGVPPPSGMGDAILASRQVTVEVP